MRKGARPSIFGSCDCDDDVEVQSYKFEKIIGTCLFISYRVIIDVHPIYRDTNTMMPKFYQVSQWACQMFMCKILDTSRTMDHDLGFNFK